LNIDRADFCHACGSSLRDPSRVEGRPEESAPSAVRYAGFWKRWIAAIIDNAILTVGVIVIFLLLGDETYNSLHQSFDRPKEFHEMIDVLFGFILGWPDYAVMESSSKQATLGKMAFGIVVSDLKGAKISFGKASVRHFGKAISFLLFWIGFIMAGLTKQKQALHDMLAGCLVIRQRKCIK
jgi:uncharacterized RDD family membrane protein YckC